MSGRLIILPKKRWNVWNRENVAKVRNDEKAHAEKLAAEAARQRELDSEARLDVLRHRAIEASGGGTPAAPSSSHDETGSPPPLPPTSQGGGVPPPPPVSSFSSSGYDPSERHVGHVHLFGHIEEVQHGQNAEYQAEKLAKERVADKRSGYAPLSLGGDPADRTEKPWWANFAAAGGISSSSSSSRQVEPLPPASVESASLASSLCPVPSMALSMPSFEALLPGDGDDSERRSMGLQKKGKKTKKAKKKEGKKKSKKERNQSSNRKKNQKAQGSSLVLSISEKMSESDSSSDCGDGRGKKRSRGSSSLSSSSALSSPSSPSIAERAGCVGLRGMYTLKKKRII